MMLKKAVSIIIIVWSLMILLFYVSCQKTEIEPLNRTKKSILTEESLVPDFEAISFDAGDCNKYSDEKILQNLTKNEMVPYELNERNKLIKLHLNGTLISQKLGVVPEQLRCFQELQDLSLANQGLTNLDNQILFELKNLEILDLSDNPLQKIDVEGFKKFRKLRFLYVERTDISTTDERILRRSLKNVQLFR